MFFVSANLAEAVGQPYRRYLTNQFRKVYGFAGSPLKVVVRGHRKEEGEPEPRKPSGIKPGRGGKHGKRAKDNRPAQTPGRKPKGGRT